jgi:hypothetical protein
MKLTIITTITNPVERQDRWTQALSCYLTVADEVIVVNGGNPITFSDIAILNSLDVESDLKFIDVAWLEDWNWVELPKHLNAGLNIATGDWVIKMDIDQFFHEKEIPLIKETLERIPDEYDVATFQKFTMCYGNKHFEKGACPIAFRRKYNIKFGENVYDKTDLCFPVNVREYKKVDGYELPIGTGLNPYKTPLHFYNYDYFFKTKDFAKKEFWSFAKAYNRYFDSWKFGDTEDKSFEVFIEMHKGRHNSSPYTTKLEDHPIFIRSEVKSLTPEKFGFNGWGVV